MIKDYRTQDGRIKSMLDRLAWWSKYESLPEVKELCTEIRADAKMLVDQQKHALSLVKALPEPDRTVIRLHYVEGLRLSDVARQLNLNLRWCNRVQARALKKLESEDSKE